MDFVIKIARYRRNTNGTHHEVRAHTRRKWGTASDGPTRHHR